MRRKGYAKFIRRVEGKKEVKYYSVNGITFADGIGGVIKPYSLAWIMYAFTWDTTPQGSNFWHKVHEGGGDQELACEILESWREQGYV